MKRKRLDDDVTNDKRRDASAAYTFEVHDAPDDLSIDPVPTSKDKIEQPPLAEHEDMFIPPRGSSVIISGKSGSGKSTLLARLITDGRFYGPSPARPNGWFDKVFLFSPTANGDDVQKALGIEKKYVFTDLDEAPELLDVILNTQQDKLEESEGADKVEQYAIIFDDVIGNVSFMNETAFTRCFYQVRHANCTTFICTQHFKRVPRICRLQANFTFFFSGSASEVETVVEEFAPPEYTSKEFRLIVNEATRKKYSFLTINMKVGWDKRFRRGLGEFIHLHRLDKIEEDEEKGDEKKESKSYANNDEKLHDKSLDNAIAVTQSDKGTAYDKHGSNEQTTV